MDEKLVAKMKELVKLAENDGSVLPVSEAFKLYPVSEEIHKGQLDYWVQEDCV